MNRYAYFLLAGLIGALATAAVFTFVGVPSGFPGEKTSSGAVIREDSKVHYHANFAVYLQDRFVDFSGSVYMQEDQDCLISTSKQNPMDRAHLHDNNGSTVHVQAPAVTWGHFFANIGWNFGKDYLVDRTDTIHLAKDPIKLRFVLNGKFIDNPFNRPIKSEDRLLVDFSKSSDAEVLRRFEKVPNDAHEYNSQEDPATCSGS